jgi:TrmH family RNA methyltransferase
VFFSESAQARAHKLLPQLPSKTETLLLPDDVLRAQPALIVIASGLQDPGNLGTIARSAEAFGATGMLLGDGTVSQWN